VTLKSHVSGWSTRSTTPRGRRSGGPTPYPDNDVKGPSAGSARQLVSTGSTADRPALERSWVNLEKDHGKDNGVHAPN
jgi:hypothetical protein